MSLKWLSLKLILSLILFWIFSSWVAIPTLAVAEEPYLVMTSGHNLTRSAAFGNRDWQEDQITDEHRDISLFSKIDNVHPATEEQPWWSMVHSKSSSIYDAGPIEGANKVAIRQCIYSQSESDGIEPYHGYALAIASGNLNIYTHGYPAKFEVSASYNTGCDSYNDHCTGNYNFEGFTLEINGPEGISNLDFLECQEGCGQNLQTKSKTFLVKNKDHFSFLSRFRGTSENNGTVNGCVDISLNVLPMQPPTVNLLQVKMVSKNELGIAAEIEYPNEFVDQPRLLQVILRRSDEKNIGFIENINNVTIPGKKVTVGVYPGDNDLFNPTTALRINLADMKVPRFTNNEKYLLDATATYWQEEIRSQPVDTEDIEILLPVLFVHGYDGPCWKNALGGALIEAAQRVFLFDELIKNTWTLPFTSSYVHDQFNYQNIDLPKYQTLWFETWPYAIKPNNNEVCVWFNNRINQINQNTYADKINVVSHSMGGLLSRYYINKCNDTNKKIVKLVMVGTPNKGTAGVFEKKIGECPSPQTLKEATDLITESPVISWSIPDSRQNYFALYRSINHGNEKTYDPNPLTLNINNNFPRDDQAGAPLGVFYSSIFATGNATPTKYIVDLVCPKGEKDCPDSQAWYTIDEGLTKKISKNDKTFEAFGLGDGFVSSASARIKGDRTRNIPINQAIDHLSLLYNTEVLNAIRWELLRNVNLK